MIYSVDGLRKDTVELIRAIEVQISNVEAAAKQKGVPANALTDSDGNWILNPLLLAKAMAYNTLVTLQSQERPVGRTGPPRRQ